MNSNGQLNGSRNGSHKLNGSLNGNESPSQAIVMMPIGVPGKPKRNWITGIDWTTGIIWIGFIMFISYFNPAAESKREAAHMRYVIKELQDAGLPITPDNIEQQTKEDAAEEMDELTDGVDPHGDA